MEREVKKVSDIDCLPVQVISSSLEDHLMSQPLETSDTITLYQLHQV